MCGGSDCKGGELTSCSCSCCCSLSLLGSAVCQQVQEQGSFQEEGVVYKASHIDAEALVPISSQAAQLCAGAGGWAPRLSSPVAAAPLQRLSSGTHFLSNLAYSLLKPDTDLLQILFSPITCSFCCLGGSLKLSTPHLLLQTNLPPKPQTDVSFVKGYCDSFDFESNTEH